MFCVWYIHMCVYVCFKVGKEREKVVPGWSRWSVGKVSDSGFENGSHSALLLPRPPSDCSKADDSTESLCIRFYCSGPLGSQKKRAPLSRSRRQPLQRSRFSLGAGKGRGGEAGRRAPGTRVRIPSSVGQARAPQPRAAPGEAPRRLPTPAAHTVYT